MHYRKPFPNYSVPKPIGPYPGKKLDNRFVGRAFSGGAVLMSGGEAHIRSTIELLTDQSRFNGGNRRSRHVLYIYHKFIYKAVNDHVKYGNRTAPLVMSSKTTDFMRLLATSTLKLLTENYISV